MRPTGGDQKSCPCSSGRRPAARNFSAWRPGRMGAGSSIASEPLSPSKAPWPEGVCVSASSARIYHRPIDSNFLLKTPRHVPVRQIGASITDQFCGQGIRSDLAGLLAALASLRDPKVDTARRTSPLRLGHDHCVEPATVALLANWGPRRQTILDHQGHERPSSCNVNDYGCLWRNLRDHRSPWLAYSSVQSIGPDVRPQSLAREETGGAPWRRRWADRSDQSSRAPKKRSLPCWRHRASGTGVGGRGTGCVRRRRELRR